MAAFVSSAESQSEFSVSSLDAGPLALTAGNFSFVYLRLGNGDSLGNIAITDTAGNTYKPGGNVAGRQFFFYAANCLGNATNTVHAAFTANPFVHLVTAQYSGMPTVVAFDVAALNQGAGGTTITVTPSSNYVEQLVIAAADLASSGHSSISPGTFTLLATGTYGPGVGSDDSWWNINASQSFNGSQAVTCTFTGSFAGSAKSLLVVIYRQSPSGVPVQTPPAAQTPCTPQATVANGGKGKAGCNVGGVGGGHQFAGTMGDVPQHADPDDGEVLTGLPGVTLEPWLELDHVDYPTDVVTTYRRAFEELGDVDIYEGGRKESGMLAIGSIEHSLSNEQGGFEAATVTLGLSDVRDRLIRDLSETQDLDNDEFRIKLASDEARANNVTPRILLRGVVQSSTLESMLKANLAGVDWLFSDFGPFGPTRKDPNWTFGDLGGAAPEMTSDTKAQPIPLLYGEKSDEDAVDPITLAVTPKGVLPGFYLGMFDLAGADVPDTPDSTGKTIEQVVAELQASVDANTAVADWGAFIGIDDAQALQDMGTVPSNYTALAQVIGYDDLNNLLQMGTTAATTDTTWGFLATGLGPWFSYTGVYGSDLGNGDALMVRDRVKLDPLARVDVLVPGINWPFPDNYFELTNPDTGRTFRLTGVFVRGPLLDDHLNSVVTMAFNAIGIEEIGDGTGNPIMRVEDMKQHRLENHWLDQWSTGPYATTLVFPQFGDGVPKVRSSSFTIRQQYFKDALGDEGILVSEYADTQQSTLDVVRQWNRDTECRLGVNQHGQIMDWGLDEAVDPTDWPQMLDVTELFGPIQRTAGEERENVVVGSCDWDNDFEKFRTGPIQFSSAAGIQKNKGRIKQGNPVDSRILDNPDHLSWVLQKRLARLQFGMTQIEVTARLNPWANYDVGSGVLVTSEDGPGPDGYVDEPFIILRRSLDVVQGLITFTLWDVKDLVTFYAGSPGVIPPVLDVVIASVGGDTIYSSDTGETIYADTV